ncbi:geranylgeranylglycerol-phosphate geranylgeranyltransferase [Bacteroidales bacterium]|nr:geranylgeranylglycerol-phosphate geranylgeranyltransferase [Bacteroidales bacterium]
MQKIAENIGNNFKLVRYQNIGMLIFTMFLLRYCIVQPILKENGLDLAFPFYLFVLLVASIALITAAGYVINDYFDRKTDLINRPQKVLIGTKINRRYAMIFHSFLNVLGVLIGIYVSYKIGYLSFSIIFLLSSGLLWFYSTTYKKQLFVGNIVVSALTAAIPFMIVVFEIPAINMKFGSDIIMQQISLKPVIVSIACFCLFAYLVNLIREIIKDAEDFEGDSAFGRNTVPIHFGMTVTKSLAITLIVTTIVCIFLTYYFLLPVVGLKNDVFTLVYIISLLIIPLIVSGYKLVIAAKKEHYSFLSQLMKAIMFFGVCYTLLFRYLIL